jgi:hypothetical protein
VLVAEGAVVVPITAASASHAAFDTIDSRRKGGRFRVPEIIE